MKNVFASALTALTILSASSAFAAPAGNISYFNAKIQLSEISVVKNGKTTTYDVPQSVANDVSFDSKFDQAHFGLRTRCMLPLLGETATEVKAVVTSGTQTLTTVGADGDVVMGKSYKIDGAVITFPKGSSVYGSCSGTAISELVIYPQEKAAIGFQTK